MRVKEYSNGELTVVWKPKQCIHAGECVKRIPQVYNPDEKPWIKVDNASTQELKDQIAACPSGALSYFMNHETKTENDMANKTSVDIIENGPLLVHGELQIKLPDGTVKDMSPTTAFCRCGHSKNKPFCDGSHNHAGFEG
jgi:uncharacterized Fe-S cluster protein YjdI